MTGMAWGQPEVLQGAGGTMLGWIQFGYDGSANFSVGVSQSCPNGHGSQSTHLLWPLVKP